MKAGCLDETTILAFLDGSLAAEARGRTEAHLAACAGCMDLVTWAAVDAANLSRKPGDERRPIIGELGPGARVGRYQILGAVGRGGMGEVYAAYHPDLDRRIALKVVFERDAGSPDRRARLLREARAIARLSHRNVVAVHDAGTVGDRVFIAMEFVDGQTVDAWLRHQPRSWREVVDIFIAAGRGLAAAHTAGVVHRDFKPQNVMIAEDGSVRVMDFGLARLVGDGIASEAGVLDQAATASESPALAMTTPRLTRTGALLGTPAYMAPEQFRGEEIDARADQFSFCVALHEALFAVRPTLEHLDTNEIPARLRESGPRNMRQRPPGWVRSAIGRGLSRNKQDRFPSMAELLRALERGRSRVRRRISGLAAAVAIALVAVVAWRSSLARRFDCAVPGARLAAVWPPKEATNPRRESIRANLLAGGGPDAPRVWERLSSALDQYVAGWGAMYTETCEATHVRGEQSGDLLDLRMRCLGENLDEVRALTDVFLTTGGTAASRALAASNGLTPVSRCADIRVLRSAVPLPRDERTLRAVEILQRQLKDVLVLFDVGNFDEALTRALALRPAVEATRYKPLLAQLIAAVGYLQTEVDVPRAEETLYEAIHSAEAAGDDVTAARAATSLSYAVGYAQGRHREGNRLVQYALAKLDRVGIGHHRLRAWALQSEAAIALQEGHLERARSLIEQSIALKERELGSDHPDVAIGLSNLGFVQMLSGEYKKSLASHDRALSIATTRGGQLGLILSNRGQVLLLLGRHSEAKKSFEQSLRQRQNDRNLAYSLTGLGQANLRLGDAGAALPFLERSLQIREREEPDPTLVAETRLALAAALWDTKRDRSRARILARSARDIYTKANLARERQEATAWLAANDRVRD